MKCFARIAFVVLLAGAASAQTPRQVSVVDFKLTDLLPGFFAELQLEDTGTTPELLFSVVVLNGDEIPVEYAPRWVQTVVAEEAALPDGYQLAQNYPNPFNTETTISFTLLESTPVELAVYNTSGQKVRTLVEGERVAGEHRMIWNGRDDKGAPVASGRYVAKMAGAGFAREMGMTLLK